MSIEWNGEGLPPVGCECETIGQHGDDNWYRCRILVHAKTERHETAVFQIGNYISNSTAEYFRPVRTEEEHKIDEAIVALTFVLTSLPRGQHVTEWSQAIVKKIAAGKIPHITLK